MLCWYRDARVPPAIAPAIGPPPKPTEKALFSGELFGIDDALDRVVDYFKAAAAGSDVGRRLLLLLGPPSGGKSTHGDPAQARARGVQPHRRRRPLRAARLAAARVAAAT